MEHWLVKSVVATLTIIPVFIAIPYFRRNHGIDPLVFLTWYFGATSVSVAAFLAYAGRASEIVPKMPVLAAIVVIGLTLGALANGSLFQAVIAAPNPGLPPAVYASASMFVFLLAAVLAASVPQLFTPVNTDPFRLGGIVLVLAGLFLLAGGAELAAGR